MSRPDPAIHPIDPSRDLTRRQLAMLTRLAEIGMEVAEAAGLKARALAEGGEAGTDGPDPALSYARAARAVRLTIALQSRLAGDLAASSRTEAARRRDRIHRRIEQAIEAGRDDEDEVEQLSSAAWERLTDEDDADLLDLPMQDVVARICADLGPLACGVRLDLRGCAARDRPPQSGFA
ncbi:MAG TPA: hypothetical protein VL460_12225 [Caulobacteraceae bacterium]|jgi:hypothetical protein|nr:hypothetical protein [Caulobacteraceae bacterium]